MFQFFSTLLVSFFVLVPLTQAETMRCLDMYSLYSGGEHGYLIEKDEQGRIVSLYSLGTKLDYACDKPLSPRGCNSLRESTPFSERSHTHYIVFPVSDVDTKNVSGHQRYAFRLNMLRDAGYEPTHFIRSTYASVSADGAINSMIGDERYFRCEKGELIWKSID